MASKLLLDAAIHLGLVKEPVCSRALVRELDIPRVRSQALVHDRVEAVFNLAVGAASILD